MRHRVDDDAITWLDTADIRADRFNIANATVAFCASFSVCGRNLT
jgi:hypothetical protein